MLHTAYGDNSLSSAQVFRWHKAFKEGRENVDDETRSGRPATTLLDENVDRVRAVLAKDRRLTVRMIGEEINLSKTVVHRIITEKLNMRKICAKLVPQVLTDDQKENRVFICQELLDRLTTEPTFLNRVITGDETWIFEYDPESKRQSSEWHTLTSPRPKKARKSKSKVKSMLIIFFDRRGLVHKEFVPPGQTVNQQFYREVLVRLRKRVLRVRPDIAESWILHHDNAPSHNALTVREFLTEKNIAILPHPPYSPDLAPCDFFVFPKIKDLLKGHHHGTIDQIQKAATRTLDMFTDADFQHCFQEWQNRWNRCVRSQGTYFEGDQN